MPIMKNKKSLKTDVQHVVTLDPVTVHPPVVSSRHASAFCGFEFDELKQSMQAAGKNIQPILVRPRVNEPGHYDLIFGERRHRVSLESKKSVQLRAIIDDSLDDVAAFFSSIRENSGRKGLSPLELGQQVLYGIDRKIFKNQEDAGRKLLKNKSVVSQAVAVASLPAEVISAFCSADSLQYRFSKVLADAVRLAPNLVKSEALKIKEGGEVLTPREVKIRLLRAAGQNVAPLNKKNALDIAFEGKKVAKMAFDTKGYPRVKLDFSLDAVQQEALVALLKRFYKKNHLRSPVPGEKNNVLSFKQATKLAERLKVKLATINRDLKKNEALGRRLV